MEQYIQPHGTPLLALPPTETTDAEIIKLWIHSKARRTKTEYLREVARFTKFVGKPLVDVTLADLQLFADSLCNLAPMSQIRILATVKSLLSFGHMVGATRYNVGQALPLPKAGVSRAERILSEEVIHRLLAMETHPTRHCLLRTIYSLGLRVSETKFRWRDLQPRDQSGQLTVVGKGQKTRTMLMSEETWKEIQSLRPDNAGDDDFVFLSREGTPISVPQVWRIVKKAAERAGIVDVSPHYLRHAHASHALDRNCPLHLLRDSLGHQSLATTSIYAHARPNDCSALYLGV